MVEALLRRSRRGLETDRMAAALRYAAMGWPVCPGAQASVPPSRHLRPSLASRGYVREVGRACSCDRIGCPAPGAHPVSPAWQIEASADPADVGRWWRERPRASIILVTGRVFDVLDVPVRAGAVALAAMNSAGTRPGPVAVGPEDRAYFFVVTRGTPAHADEWWSCHLDCEPGIEQASGLRWHCRDSYVVAPSPGGGRLPAVGWVCEPGEYSLPDALRLIGFLTDACDGVMR
ncbi:MAG TPA: bifunctional DNA primase/polymerase [Streptosporangiaceae bacterium]|nr:bifunctional DNA primase/polymerase [Streptosporangiaceae bacterium]